MIHFFLALFLFGKNTLTIFLDLFWRIVYLEYLGGRWWHS